MYLSLLEVDSRSHIARTWLGNPYRVHQRLLMAFPDTQPGRVLFRIEDEWALPRIIMQSEGEAQWDAAFGDFRVLASPVQQKSLHMDLLAGEVLRFRLRANPTKRLSAGCPGQRVDGPRVGLFKEEDQRAWVERKARGAGFELLSVDVRTLGTVVSRKSPAKHRTVQSHLAVQFDGHLRVIDPAALNKSVRCGIGTAKAYGFGLLSLAR